MGLRDIILGITPPQSVEEGDHPVTASLASARWPTWEQLTGSSGVNVARNQAMTVPTIARARNIVVRQHLRPCRCTASQATAET
jgi:hypothetical protein